MGNFDDGDSLDLKSDQERVRPSLISRIKHLSKTSTERIGKDKNYKKLEERTIKQPDRKTTQPDGRVVYEKDFGRRVGTKGEEKLRVVVYSVKKRL